MDCLFKEQEDGLGNMDPFEEGFEEDPEPEPEWADSDIDEVIPTVTSQSKRNLLFEVSLSSYHFFFSFLYLFLFRLLTLFILSLLALAVLYRITLYYSTLYITTQRYCARERAILSNSELNFIILQYT